MADDVVQACEAVVGCASLVARFTSVVVSDDACSRELGYHGVSLSCSVTVVNDPHARCVRIAGPAEVKDGNDLHTFSSPSIHCNAELTPGQLSASTYVPLMFIAPSAQERRRRADEAALNVAAPVVTAALALTEAKRELAEAEGQTAMLAKPAAPVLALPAEPLEPLEPSFALNVVVWLEKRGAGGRTSRAHITTHQSTFSADLLCANDASAKFNFTRGELIAAMKELLGNSLASARGGSLDGEDAVGSSLSVGLSPGGSVGLSVFLVSLSPMIRMLCSVPDFVIDFRSIEKAAAALEPWQLELSDDPKKEGQVRHQQLLEYGALPLFELHRHTRIALDFIRRSAPRARSDLSSSSAPPSLSSFVGVLNSAPSASLRWELLRDLDLSRLVLGDRRFVPVLAVVSVARSLRYLNVDRNELSLSSAKRLFVVLSSTPHRLERLSVKHNNFLESSGEELLRVIRHCKYMWQLDCEGNSFTPRLTERIQRAVEFNVSQMQADPYYLLGPQWSYLTSWECMPAEALHSAKAVWTMLVVAAGRPFDEAHRDKSSDGTLVATSKSTPSTGLYPLEVVAPLFSQVARLVAHNMYKAASDPTIRQVFTPVSALDGDEARTVAYSTSYFKLLTVAMRCIVETPQRWDAAAKVLAAVGEAHERCGVSHLHYSLANKYFTEAIASLCGEDVFTAAHKAGLVQFLALVGRTALLGMEAMT